MRLASPHVATVASPAEHGSAIATLVLAFSGDPVIRWLFPDSAGLLTAFPALLRLLSGAPSDGRFVDVVGADAGADAGAAIWHAPGVEVDDEALGELLAAAVAPARHPEVFGFLEGLGEYHLQHPHWYLPFVGVDPRHQGRGHGTTLLARGLARADQDGLPAYLEASSPDNRRLYERHGFEAFAELAVGSSPPLWPMCRPAS